MTRGAVGSIGIGTSLGIAETLRYVRPRSQIAERIGLFPGSDSSHKCIDLLVGEHSTGALCKGGHRSARHSIRCGTANHAVLDDCQKNGIGQSNGCATLAVRSMTSCTVLSIKKSELHYFARRHHLRAGAMCAGETGAGVTDQKGERRESSENSSTVHRW